MPNTRAENLRGVNPETEFLATAQEGNRRLFQKALTASPLGLPTRRVTERADLQLKYGNTEAVPQTLNLKRADDPTEDLIEAYTKYAEIQEKAGDKAGALSTLEKATALVPDVKLDRDGYNRDHCYSNITIAYAKLGEAEMAVQVLKNLPDEDVYKNFKRNQLFRVAVTLARDGKIDSALIVLEENGLEEIKDSFWGNLAVGYAIKGNFKLWHKAVARITSPESGLVPYSYFMRAKYHLEHGDSERAKRSLIQANRRTVIALEGADSPFYKLAYQDEYFHFALHWLKDLRIAEEIASTMAPDLFTTHCYVDLARALFSQGDRQAALKTLEVAEQKSAALPEERDQFSKATLDLAGCLWELGFPEDSERELAKLGIPDYNSWEMIDSLTERGYFKLALHLSERLSGTTKAARLGNIGHLMAKKGMVEQALPVLNEEVSLITTNIEEQKPNDEAYTKAARESHYSFEGMAKNYQLLNRPAEARQTLEQLFLFLYSTRNHKNIYWYHNVMQGYIHTAVEIGEFGLALMAAREISSHFAYYAYVNIAEGMIAAGKIDPAIEQLRSAEKLADRIPRRNRLEKSEAYLAISNAYYLLEKTLSGSMVVKG